MLPPIITPQNLPPLITPDNILTIKFIQTVPPGTPGIVTPLVYVFYTPTGGVGTGIKLIAYNEWPGYYLTMVQAAAINGDTIFASKDSDNNVLLQFSATPPLTPIINTITVTTPNGRHDGNFANIYNVGSVIANVIHASNTPVIFSFFVPKINGDVFENDYSFTTDLGLLLSYGVADGDNWQAYVILINTDPDTNANVVCTGKLLRANFFIKNNGGANIDSLDGIQNVPGDLIAVSGLGYKTQSDILGGAGDFALPILPGEISAFRLRSGFNISGTMQVKATFTVSSAQDMTVYTSGCNKVSQSTTNVPATGQQFIDAAYESNTPDTTPMPSLLYVDVQSGGGAPQPPVGVAVQAAANNTGLPADLCPAALVTYYTDNGAITTGKTVYTDIALTIPLAGNTFILSPDGNIYDIDNVTGVVGAVVGGATCSVPITGKNMFVINTDGGDITVDTNLYSFPAGTNYNVVIKSESVIVNSSGFTKVFTFYKQAPFIPANYTAGSGSPVTILSGNNITLPNDVSDYNYMSITV